MDLAAVHGERFDSARRCVATRYAIPVREQVAEVARVRRVVNVVVRRGADAERADGLSYDAPRILPRVDAGRVDEAQKVGVDGAEDHVVPCRRLNGNAEAGEEHVRAERGDRPRCGEERDDDHNDGVRRGALERFEERGRAPLVVRLVRPRVERLDDVVKMLGGASQIVSMIRVKCNGT